MDNNLGVRVHLHLLQFRQYIPCLCSTTGIYCKRFGISGFDVPYSTVSNKEVRRIFQFSLLWFALVGVTQRFQLCCQRYIRFRVWPFCCRSVLMFNNLAFISRTRVTSACSWSNLTRSWETSTAVLLQAGQTHQFRLCLASKALIWLMQSSWCHR